MPLGKAGMSSFCYFVTWPPPWGFTDAVPTFLVGVTASLFPSTQASCPPELRPVSSPKHAYFSNYQSVLTETTRRGVESSTVLVNMQSLPQQGRRWGGALGVCLSQKPPAVSLRRATPNLARLETGERVSALTWGACENTFLKLEYLESFLGNAKVQPRMETRRLQGACWLGEAR